MRASGRWNTGQVGLAKLVLARLALLVHAVLTLSAGYLLALLGAAASGPRLPRPQATGASTGLLEPDAQQGAQPPAGQAADLAPGPLRMAVLIPAHDEEAGIAQTLASLRAQRFPPEWLEVVVVADNCHDRTAAIARDLGATVFERFDPVQRGKGPALAWGMQRLLAQQPPVEGVVVLDADCLASPNLVASIEQRLRSGTAAVQVRNEVSNPFDSWSSTLRYAAFALRDTLSPLGKSRLGLSCGLFGTGMAFSRALLEQHPWSQFGVAEDGEYSLRLVEAGVKVDFAPEAWVLSAVPPSLAGATTQHLRWEGGKWQVARAWTPRLLRSGLRHRDPGRLVAGLEPLILPQSLLLVANVGAVAGAALLRSRPGLALAGVNLLAQVLFVLGGLLVIGAPRRVFLTLALAPLLVAWKLSLYARLALGAAPRDWVRTQRTGAAVSAAP